MRRLMLLCLVVLVIGGCNLILFEEGAVRLADEVKVLPAQGSSTDSGATGGTTGGGTGKQSPGGSNLLDGYLQMSLVIQQAGETPVTTDVKADVTPGG